MIDIKVEVTGMGSYKPYVNGVRVAERKRFFSFEEAVVGALSATGANLTFVDRDGKKYQIK